MSLHEDGFQPFAGEDGGPFEDHPQAPRFNEATDQTEGELPTPIPPSDIDQVANAMQSLDWSFEHEPQPNPVSERINVDR